MDHLLSFNSFIHAAFSNLGKEAVTAKNTLYTSEDTNIWLHLCVRNAYYCSCYYLYKTGRYFKMTQFIPAHPEVSVISLIGMVWALWLVSLWVAVNQCWKPYVGADAPHWFH